MIRNLLIAILIPALAWADGAVTVQGGQLTCNAGTNLNTSALATSAKQDAQTALLTTIDADTSTIAGAVSGTEMQVDIVSGSVTCNAGTNLNTSALATEATLSTLNGKVTACNTGAVTISTALPAGTNGIGKLTANSGVDIGDVDVTSIAAGNNNIGDVDVASIAAGTALIGRVSASDETTTIYEGATSLTPKFAVIDVASSGDNTIVAGVAGKKIRVLNVVLIASGAVNVRFESGASGTALTGQMNLTTNSGFAPGYVPVGHFQTADDALLNLELSGAVSVDGWLTYVEAD